MGSRFVYEFARDMPGMYNLYLPSFLRPSLLSKRQWVLSVHGENINTASKSALIVEQFIDNALALEAILSKKPFLFGNRPTLVDFGFAGPFFRHFSSDATARKILQLRAPHVFEWVGRLWNAKASNMSSDSGFPERGQLPSSWGLLLKLLPEYLQYSQLNAAAYKAKQSFFEWNYRGEVFKVPVVPYRVWCRTVLHQRFQSLDATAQTAIEAILRQHNCWDLLWMGGTDIVVPPECGVDPPFCVPLSPKDSILVSKWDEDAVKKNLQREQVEWCIAKMKWLVLPIGIVLGLLWNRKR